MNRCSRIQRIQQTRAHAQFHLARLHGGTAGFRLPHATGAMADDFYHQNRIYRRSLVPDVALPMPPLRLQASSSDAASVSTNVDRSLGLLSGRPLDSILARGDKSPSANTADGRRIQQQGFGRNDVIGELFALLVRPSTNYRSCRSRKQPNY